MSIRAKFVAVLVLVSAFLTLATFAITQMVVMPSFVRLEQIHAQENMSRVLRAIDADLDGIDNTAMDWSAWDESYQFVRDRNQDFANGNLLPESFGNSELNLIAFFDENGKKIWGELRELDRLQVLASDQLFLNLQSAGNSIIHRRDILESIRGIIPTRHGPLLISAKPILTTKREGPCRGTLIMGRLMDEGFAEELSARTCVKTKIWEANANTVEEPERAIFQSVILSGGFHINNESSEQTFVYGTMDDLHKQPAIYLRIEVPRTISQQGALAGHWAIGSTIVCSVGITLVLGLVMQLMLVGPIVKITNYAVAVGNSSETLEPLEFYRGDEVGVLAREIDNMVFRLTETRKEMVESAHQAGMAEIATDTLHNVGNAVNSINISSDMLESRLKESKISFLGKAVDMLRSNKEQIADFLLNDPRGVKVIEYIISATGMLQKEHIDNLQETERLKQVTNHIREIIATQQEYAKPNSFGQELQISELLDDVIRMHKPQLDLADIQLDFRCEQLPSIMINKSKVLQIITNLVKNGIEAMREVEGGERVLEVIGRRGGDDDIIVEIADRGMGIAPENIVKIFGHGFTTKATGHGFGLHYCANAMNEMGGSISVQSDGIGKGAKFTLRLPKRLPASNHEPELVQ